MTPRQTFQDIRLAITQMIEAGLSNEQRYPTLRNTGSRTCEIGIEGAPDLSASLRNIPYSQAFLELERARAFNLKMIDGALVQLVYRFENDDVSSHRLAFFPAPALQTYDDARQVYEEDEMFGDIVGKYLVRFPLRFDFSADPLEHIEVDHPKSHLTLGQYQNCRIPVTCPLTPVRFVNFVVRNFYFLARELATFDSAALGRSFPETITERERSILHVSV